LLRRATYALLIALVLASLLPGTSGAASGPRPTSVVRVRHAPAYDLSRYVSPSAATGRYSPSSGTSATAVRTPAVGTIRKWIAIDDFKGIPYLQKFKLRGKGKHIEVWVATGKALEFQSGDCRNDSRTKITDKQVDYLIDEFDGNIYPKETVAFAKPRDRNGTGSKANQSFDVSKGEYKGDADNTVVLVYNVRDDVYYDKNNTQDLPFVAGFFSPGINELTDRNVMTVDSFDWSHRTGSNPLDNPSSNNCTNAPGSPFLVESTFAHEWQHLIEYYSDNDEYTWTNEGLSEWAISLTGYGDPSKPITDPGFDASVQCFLGNLGSSTASNGGPENSLTEWEDQVDPQEILCDYGAVRSFMEYLSGRYGSDIIGRIHRNEDNGLHGLQSILDSSNPGDSAIELVHDWAAMVALDSVLDDGAALSGGASADFKTPTLDALVNWNTPDAFSMPGAPPNGSDYVRVRSGAGSFLNAGQIDSISFAGQSVASKPVDWIVDGSPPDHASNPAVYSGEAIAVDRSAILEVAVPAGNPTLTFETRYQTEAGYDFGFVRVSTDGGRTFKSLSNPNTSGTAGDGAIRAVTSKLPGFTGNSQGWKSESFNLSPYAGRTVHISFQYISDGVTAGPGWWLDDVKVAGTLISDGSDLSVWKSPTEVRPFAVSGYTVQLIAYDDAHTTAWIARLPISGTTGSLSGAALDAAIGTTAQTVAVLVMEDDLNETIPAYARYELKVNGVAQSGG
jgi:hypothetical protein